MGNKIITEKDFWICSGGTTPAQLQSTQLSTKKDSGQKYITVSDTATSSWIDFGCRKLMLIMAILAAVIVVAVVATGGAALGVLIAAGAIAGAAGAAFGAVVGALICGQKAAAARKWLRSKPDMIIQGQQSITGDHQMKCMLFGETIAFAPQIKNWWQAVALGASNYIGGILEGAMYGAAIGATGGIISGGPAALGQFGLSNVAANWLATWGGWGLGLRGLVTAQSVLGAYGNTGEVTADDVISKGVFGLETGTLHSVRNIVTGNGTMTDLIGVGLWFVPAPRRSRSEETRTRTEETRNEEAKNEEAPRARGNESEAPRREGEFEAYEEGKATTEPPAEAEPPVAGETASTRVGKEVHKRQADERRASGEFDEVNSPIKDKSGEPIRVPKRVDLETGKPQPDSPLQEAIPDAVSYDRKLIVDDKPAGRPIRKDRQEIIRFLEAYKQREGVYPDTIEIHRYDPKTGEPAGVEIYTPEEFLPGKK